MALKEKKKLDQKSEDVLKKLDKINEEDEKKNKKAKDKKDDKKKSDVKKDKKPVVRKESWWAGVKQEFKNVRWPNKKEMVKYSIATITFIVFFALFFFAIEMIVWLIERA